MSLRVEAGFTIPAGGWDFHFNEGGGNLVATLAAGTYCHTDLSSIDLVGSGNYTALGPAIKAAMDAAGGDTYTVTWTGTTPAYTIASSGTFYIYAPSTPLIGNEDACFALGFNALTSVASSHDSQVVPYYVIPTSIGAMSSLNDDHESDNVAEGAESDDGYPYSIAKDSVANLFDFRVEREEWAKVKKYKADPSAPWTWQHFYEHCRGHVPFASFDSANTNTVHLLKSSAAGFNPTPIKRDFLNYWSLELSCYLLGRI